MHKGSVRVGTLSSTRVFSVYHHDTVLCAFYVTKIGISMTRHTTIFPLVLPHLLHSMVDYKELILSEVPMQSTITAITAQMQAAQ